MDGHLDVPLVTEVERFIGSVLGELVDTSIVQSGPLAQQVDSLTAVELAIRVHERFFVDLCDDDLTADVHDLASRIVDLILAQTSGGPG